MVVNNENILVDFDYQNVLLVDPNKIIDNDGNVKERSVRQENFVMYANLECKVSPRTRLSLGIDQNDNEQQTISVATINFLNPGLQKFLTNKYTDEITGRGALEGQGINQAVQSQVSRPLNSDEYYLNQTFMSEGQNQTTQTGLLGIRSINIQDTTKFFPTVEVRLIDVRGRALFELGDNSPYSVFFQYPYPPFFLTIKGYYGKAIRYKLLLKKFKSRYDSDTGSFDITLSFEPYQFNILGEVTLSDLIALPNMYETQISTLLNSNASNNNVQVNTNQNTVSSNTVTKGYEKIREVYNEYKSKNLIDKNVPEYTLIEFRENLVKYIQNIQQNYQKQSLTGLTNAEIYKNDLGQFTNEVYSNSDSWWKKNIDLTNGIVLGQPGDLISIFPLKKEINDDEPKRKNTDSQLESILNTYKKKLTENQTFGLGKSYTIGTKNVSSEIPFNLIINDFYYNGSKTISTTYPINYEKTLIARSAANSQPTTQEINDFKNKLDGEIQTTIKDWYYYVIESIPTQTFFPKVSQLQKEIQTKKQELENNLTEFFAKDLTQQLGYEPTIKNMIGIIVANTEAFLRLLDDVHVNAWYQRDNPTKKSAIIDNSQNSVSVDKPNIPKKNQPVYPWPQLVKEKNVNNKTIYEISYPGDYPETGSNDYNIWPEVEFVEEYLTGLVQRINPSTPKVTGNNALATQYITYNSVEYPLTAEIYANKQEVKFIYEIYERLTTYAFYSKLGRTNSVQYSVFKTLMEAELNNIQESLKNSNPFLIQTLKNFTFNAANFELILRHISNEGTGESWENYSRGIYNSPYLESVTQTPYYISSFNPPSQKQGVGTTTNLENYLTGSTIDFDQTDVYPYVIGDWVLNNVANSTPLLSDTKNFFNTSKVLKFNNIQKQITNYENNTTQIRPFTNIASLNSVKVGNLGDTSFEISTKDSLESFYNERKNEPTKQYVTEGNLNYSDYDGYLVESGTTSMLNTPYFINAILQGVENYKNFNKYPYREAAYLFLNSLPLSTLKEKYLSGDTPVDELDYILSTFKKYGSIHKLPFAWILKYGSIWHRYKNWVETGTDFMVPVWKNFDAVANYDPLTNDPTTKYSITANQQSYEVVLQEDITTGLLTSTQMDLGFYPRLMNDFNYFYNGLNLFSAYTSQEIQKDIDSEKLVVNYFPDGILNFPFGIDPADQNRNITIKTWSCMVKDDIDGSYLVIPSFGSKLNQTKFECFKQSNQSGWTMGIEIKNNPAVFNGSARMFWTAPNYGYFDNSKVALNRPDQYLKQILKNRKQQENFRIQSEVTAPIQLLFNDVAEYSFIDEMFSVFEKGILDLFEQQFLEFSKSRYDYENILKTPEGYQTLDTSLTIKYKNFQNLMRDLMKVVPPTVVSQAPNDVVKNVRELQLSSITKLVNDFVNYDILFDMGNPSNYDKQKFFSLTRFPLVDKYIPRPYTVNTPFALPAVNNTTTLAQSVINYPEEWRTLELYIGFSTIPELIYKDAGSYITDFFIDLNIEFTVQNIEYYSYLIKIYATQKLYNPNITSLQFSQILQNYIETTNIFRNDMVNDLMPALVKNLPSQTITKTPKKAPVSGKTNKIEVYEKFKALNDKYIAGNDYKLQTLFQDFYFVDRASRNVGGSIYCDVVYWKNRIDDLLKKNPEFPIKVLLEELINEAGFNTYQHPGYVNYYDVNDINVRPNSKNQGSTQIANDIFGTHLDVDYRKSRSKWLNILGTTPSVNLDIPGNDFKNDIFQLSRQSDMPLLEDQTNKNDWAYSNKVVAFNVDIGTFNQGVFKNFDINMETGQKTAEQIEIEYETAQQAGGQKSSAQSYSMYNLYKYRVYSCNISMMGCAVIQPLMWFNLRNVPMFYGPYVIRSVSHSIAPGNFSTDIVGYRQRIAEYAPQDTYLQSIREQFVTPLLSNILTTTSQGISTNIGAQQQNKIKSLNSRLEIDSSDSCSSLKGSSFQNILYSSTTTNTSTLKSVIDEIVTQLNNPVITLDQTQKQTLRDLTFTIIYLSNGNVNNSNIEHEGFNLGDVDLTNLWSGIIPSIINTNNKGYFCGRVQGSTESYIPYPIFSGISTSIEILINYFESVVKNDTTLLTLTNVQKKTEYSKIYTLYWPRVVQSSVWDTLPTQDKESIEKKAEVAIGLIPQLV